MKTINLEKHDLPYAVQEELKTLRTNLLFCGDEKKVILLTSCVSGEGKTTTALNLARSMAELDKNVLLIDADLRRSAIRKKVTAGKIDSGLVHYLVGHVSANDMLYQTETKGVYLMPAGANPPNPTELLSNWRFSELLKNCREQFDYIIVDCPPLGMVIDAAVVAPMCDGAVLLIEAGNVQYRYAQEVAAKLRVTKCPILGVVLNKVDSSTGRYYGRKYGYGYGKYYKYYSHYEY